jgi:8-oxo-dGTP pyrophosphatase MutT (NUDIX family)
MQAPGKLLYWTTLPVLKLVLNGTHRSRILVEANGEILLVKPWVGSGHWMLPGGGIDKGEDFAGAAARELLEETGIRIAASRLEHLGNLPFDSFGLRYVTVNFYVSLRHKPKKVFAEQFLEIAAYAWVPIDQLPPDCSPEVSAALALRKEGNTKQK